MSIRTDRYEVGDVVEWHLPTVMDHCRTWAPALGVEYRIIAVADIEGFHSQKGAGHTQLVRVSPNYCPYGDEFSGAWFNPIKRESV